MLVQWKDQVGRICKGRINEAVPLHVHEVEPSQSRIPSKIHKGNPINTYNHMTLGVKLLQSTPSPPSKIIASILEQKTQASADDHKRRNPSMPQALNGPGKLQWLDSNEKDDKRF